MLRRSEPGYRWIAEVLDLGPTHRFLDVGCGPGGLLRVAREKGAEVVGVDSSADMVRLASRDGTVAHCASVDHLPMASGDFSTACALHTIEFWESRIAGLVELRRVMRPAGRLCVVVRRLDVDARPWNPSRHGFGNAQLHALHEDLVAAGFTTPRREERAFRRERLIAITSEAS